MASAFLLPLLHFYQFELDLNHCFGWNVVNVCYLLCVGRCLECMHACIAHMHVLPKKAYFPKIIGNFGNKDGGTMRLCPLKFVTSSWISIWNNRL
jgi:hypothetical protein